MRVPSHHRLQSIPRPVGRLGPNDVLVRHQRTELAHPGQRVDRVEHVIFGTVLGANRALADRFHLWRRHRPMIFAFRVPIDSPSDGRRTAGGDIRAAGRCQTASAEIRGTCAECGTPLAQGADALYDRRLRTVRCVACPVDGDATAIDPGVAGASAQREYERRVASRQSRINDRFGRHLGGVILAVPDQPKSTKAWARGSAGERELAEALADVDGVRVLNDRRVPGTRGNLDHIVIAPAGLFVVDAKLYAGTIRVRDIGGLFRRDERLYIGRRDCSRLAENMKWQVEAVERALGSAEIEPPPPVTPVLCFVRGEWPLLFPPDSYRGVRLEGSRSIKKLIRRETLLDDAAVDRVWRGLAAALPPR